MNAQPPLARWTSSSAAPAAMPDTVMASAFLVGVMRWAAKQSHTKRLVLPTGAVDADELRKVLVALTCARGALNATGEMRRSDDE